MQYYLPGLESSDDFGQTQSNILKSIDCVDQYKCNFVLPGTVEVYNPINGRSSIWATIEKTDTANVSTILRHTIELLQKIGTATAVIIEEAAEGVAGNEQ